MRGSKPLVALLVAGLIGAFLVLDLGRFLTLDALRGAWVELESYARAKPVLAIVLFFLGYVALAGLSLPGAVVMALAAGAVYGVLVGTVVASFASTTGATVAFLISRFLLRDTVQRRFGRRIGAVNRGIERDGVFYLFALRMVPVIPFQLVNLLMGLLPIRGATFFLVSQAGMLSATIFYVHAGTRLAALDSSRELLSPGVIVAFSLVGVLPLVGCKLVRARRARRA